MQYIVNVRYSGVVLAMMDGITGVGQSKGKSMVIQTMWRTLKYMRGER